MVRVWTVSWDAAMVSMKYGIPYQVYQGREYSALIENGVVGKLSSDNSTARHSGTSICVYTAAVKPTQAFSDITIRAI